MEEYEGIKFKTKKLADDFSTDTRLAKLNYWIAIFGDLGLAPIHPHGAYGNHSYRVDDDSFIITRTGMKPRLQLRKTDYCLVRYDQETHHFQTKGRYAPSSECFLHSLIYSRFPHIKVVMHGHSTLLNSHASQLAIQTTPQELPYGTEELARAAVKICSPLHSFFIMKNHGFVATGKDIDATAKMVVKQYSRLLGILMQEE